MTFNPNEHISKIKTKQGLKDYLPIQWRLVWFRDAHPHGEITTELLQLDLERKIAVFKAIVIDGEGGIATGHGTECEADFPDYIEKAETKSIGRALAALGYGTQFTGDELNEEHRIADAPVERNGNGISKSHAEVLHDLAAPGAYEDHHVDEAPTAAQLAQIKELANKLNKKVQRPVSIHQATNLIRELLRESEVSVPELKP